MEITNRPIVVGERESNNMHLVAMLGPLSQNLCAIVAMLGSPSQRLCTVVAIHGLLDGHKWKSPNLLVELQRY